MITLKQRIKAMQHVVRQYPEAVQTYCTPDSVVELVLLLEEVHFLLKDNYHPEVAELKAEISRCFKGEYNRSGIEA
jgi:hypothetical protein